MPVRCSIARHLPLMILTVLFIILSSCDSPTYPYFATSGEQTVLDKDTSVVLYFDSSGSMNALLPVLQEMIATGGPLYEKLHQTYGDDYPNKVFIRENGTEDTLAMLALRDMPEPRPAKCAVFVFQDENDGEDVSPNSTAFQDDMDTLHTRIDSEFSFYRGVVVQIDDGAVSAFESTFQAFESGTAPYESSNQNLTSYTQAVPPKIKILYKVPVSDAATYSDLTVNTLRDMGIQVP